MDQQRAVIVGGPRTGKSTLAREFRAQGIPTLCGDPASLAKEVDLEAPRPEAAEVLAA